MHRSLFGHCKGHCKVIRRSLEGHGKVIVCSLYFLNSNTGGLGGAFGYFYGVGRPLPFPEGRPFKKSFQFRLLEFIGNLGKMLKKKQ